jgi:hypothetical protein
MPPYKKQSEISVTSCGVDKMLGATTTPNINAKP